MNYSFNSGAKIVKILTPNNRCTFRPDSCKYFGILEKTFYICSPFHMERCSSG